MLAISIMQVTTATPHMAKLLIAFAVNIFVSGSLSAQTATNPQLLSSGTPVGPISGAATSTLYYKLKVLSGATSATFAIVGTSGDCDIYVKFGAIPTTSTWDYRPYTSTSKETVSVSNPAA